MTQEFQHLTSQEWITLARSTFAPEAPEPCAICGCYRSLAQAHHVVPLSAQARLRPGTVNHDHVWLCPTHHALVHVLISQHEHHTIGDRTAPSRGKVIIEFSAEYADELTAANAIAARASA